MRLAEDVKEIGQIESQPELDGRNMVMVLGPTKNAGQKERRGADGRGSRSGRPRARSPERNRELETMPKQKTNSAAKKRFKVTGAGKILRRHAMKSHNLEKKSAKRKRTSRGTRPCTSRRREARKLLGRGS